MQRASQLLDLRPKKLPSQRRSRETFDALVEACAWLLAERGYAGATTNHIAERAGVNIASLYEYFPGKDAIVAQVAERMVQRVLDRLAEGAAQVTEAGEDEAVRRWLEWIHETLARERLLVGVFLYQVPFTNQLPCVQAIGERLLAFSRQVQTRAGGFVQPGFTPATLQQAFEYSKGYVSSFPTADGKSRTIFRVADVIAAGTPTADEAAALNAELARQQRIDVLDQYVAGLRARYGITVNEKLVADVIGGKTEASSDN